MSPQIRTFLRPAGDALLLFVALAAANALIGRSDPGWLNINPAPFLAVPVLIGARYGFSAGLAAGTATVAAILSARFGLLGEFPATAWDARPITLTAFPLLGALSGELRRLYASALHRLQDEKRRALDDSARLEREVDLLRESNRNLSQDAALHGVELAALDLELRDILSSGTAGIFGNSLEFLRRVAGVEEAAFFRRQGSTWIPLASTILNPDDNTLDELGSTMANHAFEKKDLVTWAGLWLHAHQNPRSAISPAPSPDPVAPWLAALPWQSPGARDPDAVLMVRTIPLRHATWDNFARISTVCRWVAGLALARPASHLPTAAAPATAKLFRNLLGLAAETASAHQLPSALLALRPDPEADPASLAAQIASTLRPNDIFTKIPHAKSSTYAALLPLAGLRDASRILAQLQNAEGHVIAIDGQTPPDQLWQILIDGTSEPGALSPSSSPVPGSQKNRDPNAEAA